jgi:hypothetical protein
MLQWIKQGTSKMSVISSTGNPLYRNVPLRCKTHVSWPVSTYSPSHISDSSPPSFICKHTIETCAPYIAVCNNRFIFCPSSCSVWVVVFTSCCLLLFLLSLHLHGFHFIIPQLLVAPNCVAHFDGFKMRRLNYQNRVPDVTMLLQRPTSLFHRSAIACDAWDTEGTRI